MCNISRLIENTKTYINEYIGEKVVFSPINASLQNRLPIAISGEFNLYSGRILNCDVVLALIEQADIIPPKQIQKKLLILEQKLGSLVILATQEIASYNALRLANLRVNFIVPNKQMFLPSLLVNFRKEQQIGSDLTETISPTAQVLLLYHLQVESVQGLDARALASKLDVSYASANRAIRWLYDKELIKVSQGKSKLIELHHTPRELWEKALPFLESPVAKIVYTDDVIDTWQSGINALSEYTMINPEPRACYAITKAALKTLSTRVNEKFGNNIVEIWKYSPHLLSSTNTVDKLSLYLSLRQTEDERVQIELDNLLNALWSEE
ncbi:hypothetical protein HQ38_00695 [Porphyromonas crevioricanis]|uniref:MarR family transcriptional regulator n=1 Tax=Porphyromonas crevioricanis TaxID=393921 RepID=A0AB34PHH7_9PORP|nr:hypothetical protein HQ38_00695 [Porphyromonas crevioricanis]